MIAVGRATLEGMTKWGNYNWSGNAFHLLSPVLISEIIHIEMRKHSLEI